LWREPYIWDAGKSQLYCADCVGLRVYRYDWLSKTHTCIKAGIEVNGIALDQSGGLVVTNNSGVWKWDGRGELRLIAAQANSSKCRMNDCIADPQGRLIAGSWFYSPDGSYELGKLMSIENDGTVRVLDEGFHLPNGLGFSVDAQTLYFTDSVARRIFAYDYDVTNGLVSNRRIFIDLPITEGRPDAVGKDSAATFKPLTNWSGVSVP
jgi:sugar lactone lactonase YvrE